MKSKFAFFGRVSLILLFLAPPGARFLFSSEIPDLFVEETYIYNANDLFRFACLWNQNPSTSGEGDLNSDGFVDSNDLLLLIDAFAAPHPTITPDPGEEPITPTPAALSTPTVDPGDDPGGAPTPTRDPPATPTPESTDIDTPTPTSSATPAPAATVYQPDFVRIWKLHPSLSLFNDPVNNPFNSEFASNQSGYAIATTNAGGEDMFVAIDRSGRIFNRTLPISTKDYSGLVLTDGGGMFGKFFESPRDTRRFRFEPFDLDAAAGEMMDVEHLGADAVAWTFCGSEKGFAMAVLRYPNIIALHRISADGVYLGKTEYAAESIPPVSPAAFMAAWSGDSIAVAYAQPSESEQSLTVWIFSSSGEPSPASPIVLKEEPCLNRLIGDSSGAFYVMTQSSFGLRLNRLSSGGVLLNQLTPIASLTDMQWQDDLLWLLDGRNHTMIGLNENGDLANGPVFLRPPNGPDNLQWLRLKKSGPDLGVFFTDAAARDAIHYMQIEAGDLATPTPMPAAGASAGATAAIELAEGISIEMRKITRGAYLRGSPEDEQGRRSNEGPQHSVTLTYDFYISAAEITNLQYKQFDPNKTSSTYENVDLSADDLPVVNVTWEEADAFCQWLSSIHESSFSLPSEAEWEYAARAGTETRRPWGEDLEDLELCSHANTADIQAASTFTLLTDFADCDDGFAGPSPVKSYPPNALGLYGMLGNVREWCMDWFEKYSGDSLADPMGPARGFSRVIRGGSWRHTPDFARCAYRSGDPPSSLDSTVGFRIVMRTGPN